MNTIPVLIHHELDEKPQTGGKRNQGYVKDCIIQAKQYYQNVILFGSEGNQSFCEQWRDVSDFNSKKWQEFLAVFENMSTYPDEWARGIFKRFFVFLEYLKETGGRECIVLDSDVLIYQDYSELFDFSDIDAAMELPSNQKMEMLPYNNDYRWVACAGVSYFKTEALEDFLDFCIETYKNNKGLLNKKWEIHRKYGLPGGVCEMSLLYLWQKSRNQMKILNLSKPFQGILPCVVVNQNCSEYTGQVYKMERLTGNKCIYINFKDHVPYIQYEEADFRSQDGEDFRVSALHFGGNSKIFINGLRKKQVYTMLSLSEYSYWRLRNRLSKIKSRFKARK